ncbi:MAG TPA: phosphomannomutase/phosphoglucomutase, partial [Actinomycetota bacterium]|nr:phosphomannomutase/phosphoglucomutase [Actinomycetota bacterium]
MAADLEPIFKAYDVRGIYPEQFDEDAAYRIGRAFASWSKADRIVMGRDCRPSSPALSDAFAAGLTGRGVGIVDLGLATTDMVYFASGRLSLPGAMFTASHNPPEYNGLKLCLSGARPVGADSGLDQVRAGAEREPPRPPGTRADAGLVAHRDMRE